MTQWVETVEGGRDRGARGLARAYVEVLVRPVRFFRTGVAPGDQAPGLVFAVGVAAVAAAGWLATLDAAPLSLGPEPLEYALALIALAGFVAPLALHLVAAVQTVVLLAFVPAERRAGIGETVQVLAYATAPCVVAGLPVPALRLAAACYATVLLATGLAVRNDCSVARGALLGAPAAALTFGTAYQGFGAVVALGAQLGPLLG